MEMYPLTLDANLTGAFFANGDFNAGTTLPQTDKQLVIYGSVAANADLMGGDSVNSQRDLGGVNVPSEFTDAVMDWKEVAP